jgi:hypothetical protein
VVEGCANAVRLEHEHVKDWATTKVTRLGDLARPCKACHDLKTYHGYHFGPRLPNGKRRLIPPDDARPTPPVDPGTPTGSGTPPEPTRPHDPAPPGLFDTG